MILTGHSLVTPGPQTGSPAEDLETEAASHNDEVVTHFRQGVLSTTPFLLIWNLLGHVLKLVAAKLLSYPLELPVLVSVIRQLRNNDLSVGGRSQLFWATL